MIFTASNISAATSGQIAISATVPEIAAITAADTGAATIDQLGNQDYTNVKIGIVTLQSNDAAGFTLTLDSATNGVLAKDGTGTAADETIAYTVSLTNGSGTLGTNITESGLTDANPEGGVMSFTGTSVTPTVGRQYDVGISTVVKGLVQGSYSDTLTITIANQ